MPRKSVVRERVLHYLTEVGGPVPQSSIHRVLGLSKSRVSEVLNDLEDEGLIRRFSLGNQFLVEAVAEAPRSEHLPKTLKVGVVWSSEYPFLTPYAKRLAREGIKLKLVVFGSAVDAVKSLIMGEIDLALAPLITELHFYASFRNIKVIGGGAYGGASVLVRRDGGGEDAIGSSYLSTMDVLRASALMKGEVDAGDTLYFRRPSEAVKLVRKGEVRYMSVWHPLTKELIAQGMKPLADLEQYGIKYCCTLAASSALPPHVRRFLRRTYSEALDDFIKSPGRWFEWYSLQIGIGVDVVKDGWRHYKINKHITRRDVIKYLRSLGYSVPEPAIVAEAVDS
ncbi:MAG: MarR family transcriptional regulator [Desulfurococcales archaeon]|nr:MarR family transcriptional regulator [Desulfurococcales archaeon]